MIDPSRARHRPKKSVTYWVSLTFQDPLYALCRVKAGDLNGKSRDECLSENWPLFYGEAWEKLEARLSD